MDFYFIFFFVGVSGALHWRIAFQGPKRISKRLKNMIDFFEEKKIPARSTERKDESIIKQGSLNYPFAGDQTMQMYGHFERFPL